MSLSAAAKAQVAQAAHSGPVNGTTRDKTDLEVCEDMLLQAQKHLEAKDAIIKQLEPKAEAYQLLKQFMGMHQDLQERRVMMAPYGEAGEYNMAKEIEMFLNHLQEKKLNEVMNQP